MYSEAPFASTCEGWEGSPEVSIRLPSLAILSAENNNEGLDSWHDERGGKNGEICHGIKSKGRVRSCRAHHQP